MYNGTVKKMISEKINAMLPELEEMVDHAPSSEMAAQNVMNYASSKIVGMSRGWLSTEYAELSEKTLSEDIFQIPVNANKFYALELQKEIMDKYKLDIKTLNSYKEGMTVREVNRIYASAGAAVGTAAVGGILLGVLSGAVDIPLVVIIAGAVACALVGGGVTYAKIVPNVNKNRYKEALRKFSVELTSELCQWVDTVADFYDAEVSKLKETL